MKRRELPGIWLAMHAHDTESEAAILDMVRLSYDELAELPIDEGRAAAGALPIKLFKQTIESVSEELEMGNEPAASK